MFSKKAKGLIAVVAWHAGLIGCLLFWIMLGFLSYPLGAGPMLIVIEPWHVIGIVLMLGITVFTIIMIVMVDLALLFGKKTLEDVGEQMR